MLVNGLAGSSANWFTVMERLTDLTDPRLVLPVPSEANAGRSGTVQLQYCQPQAGSNFHLRTERLVEW